MAAVKEILYKAVVRDKRTKKVEIISFTACNLTHALHEIRANGYQVHSYHGLIAIEKCQG